MRSPTSKAVFICFGLFTFQRLSGVSAVVYYTVDIFRGAESSVPPATATIIVGFFAVLSSAASAILVDKLGRRFLLIFSNVFMSLSLAIMAVYSILLENGVLMQEYGWIPLLSLSILISVFRIGIGPIPWFMTPELLPTEVKQWATSSVVCYTWCLTFFITKVFVWFVDNLAYSGTYSLMCLVCVVGVIFEVFCVPETKNKTPDEIRSSLIKSKYNSITQIE
uniref:Major facilitator superfamily (MFS) profile domain-containing protein n=1 Tax=Clastoptera arizonana TaxID=38151 RepID=A0A1B6BY04_9HEMI